MGKNHIPHWQAYGVLFQTVMNKEKGGWSVDQLVDELNRDADLRNYAKCRYSRRSIVAYQTAKQKHASRNPKRDKVKHLHEFFTDKANQYGVYKKFERELLAIAPSELLGGHIVEDPSSDMLSSGKTAVAKSICDSPTSPHVSGQLGDTSEKYAAAIINRFGKLPLEFIDPTGTFYQALSLTRLYVPQFARDAQQFLPATLESSTGHAHNVRNRPEEDASQITSSDSEKARQQFFSQECESLLEIIANPANSRIVILGGLGAGKSSLIQFLAIRWAEANKVVRDRLDLPILIELKSYILAQQGSSQNDDLVEYLSSGTASFWKYSKEEISKRFNDGSAVLYLDGLDEILAHAQHEKAVASIIRFANQFPKTRLVLTARLSGFREAGLRRAGFKHWIIEDFNKSQIETFIDRWYLETGSRQQASRARSNAKRFQEFIFCSDTLHELARNPLFLTIILHLGREDFTPKRKVELLEQCAIMLLDKWKVHEALAADPFLAGDAMAISIREKKTILRDVVRRMNDRSTYPKNIISIDELELSVSNSIKKCVRSNPVSVARAIIRQLRERNGILRMDSVGYYAFVHPSFMEYFCADDLCQSFAIEKTINEAQLKRLFESRIFKATGWDEILCFFCGMIEPRVAGRLVAHIFKHNKEKWPDDKLFGLADCLKEINGIEKVDKELLMPIRNVLLEVAKYKFEKKRVSSLPSNFSTAWRSMDYLGSIFCGDSVVTNFLKNAIKKSVACKGYENSIRALTKNWRRHAYVRDWLQSCAEEFVALSTKLQKNVMWAPYARDFIIEEIASKWPDSQTLEFLKQLCNKCKRRNTDSARTALYEIAVGWNVDDNVFNWLLYFYKTTPSVMLKGQIVYGIADGFINKPGVLEWVQEIASNHRRSTLRNYAVQSLAGRINELQGLAEFLKKIIKSERNVGVLRMLFFSIPIDEYETPAAQSLFDCVIKEVVAEDLRNWALEHLSRDWKSNAENLSILVSIAESNNKSQLWCKAVETLLEFWPDKTEYEFKYKMALGNQRKERLQKTISILEENYKRSPSQSMAEAVLELKVKISQLP